MNKLICFLSIISIYACNKDSTPFPVPYQTENIIIVIVDGVRYSESWGDTTHQYIPKMANDLSKEGIIFTDFFTNGPTFTVPGHTAMTTGHYQEISNGGAELPEYSSIFQHWLQTYQEDSTKAWIISSKDKLEVLANCNNSKWKDKFKPATNCGVNGLGTGYRHDSITYENTIDILSTYHPRLVLINFREPDFSAHQNSWDGYIKGIQDTDEYVFKIWTYLQVDSFYNGSTTLFVTNDHGRHLDSVKNGFVSHGDDCDGCKHINLFACGPDFKQDCISNSKRELIDIPATIAKLMSFEIPKCNGVVIEELFNE